MELNLARDPFRNQRPVRRAGLLLAVLGLVLAAVDARTYWRHFSGENQTRVQLQGLDAEISAERAELARLREELSRLEVEDLNRRARFVNGQIAQRTFSWSGLFDDIVAILPGEAQLVSLEPQFERGRRSRRELDLEPGEVLLEIDGIARDTPRLLALLDQFFAHPEFRLPDLQRESQSDAGIEFTLAVIYRPRAEAPPPPVEAPAEEAAGEETEEEAPEAPEAGDPAAVETTARVRPGAMEGEA